MFFAVTLLIISPTLHAQFINTIAGNGSSGYVMDGVPATGTKINGPGGIYVDNAYNVYFADYANSRIRKIDAYGIITTVVGTGAAGYSGDGGPATAAQLDHPSELLFDNSGNMIISDYRNHALRKVTPAGIITTICGTGTVPGSSGDGGLAVAAKIRNPVGLFLASSGDLYFCDAANHNIRMINTAGYISHIAGSGVSGYAGDGFAASTCKFADPYSVALDNAGNIYIADQSNNRIRMINTLGIINTIVGTGTPGFSGDGGAPLSADIHRPTGLMVEPVTGVIFFTDRTNACVRKVAGGVINTIIGTGTVYGFSGDGGPATAAVFTETSDLFVNFLTGTIYVSDYNNSRIRRTSNCILPPPVNSITAPSGVCIGSSFSATNTTSGGLWSTSNSHASIGSTSGFVTGLSSGTATISYSVTNDCGSSAATAIIKIDTFPSAGTITSASSVCLSGSLTLSDAVTGGIWSSSNTTVATVSGIILSPVATGTTTISYTITNTCGTAVASRTVTVLTVPLPGTITAPSSVCPLGSISMSSTVGGGTWSSGNTTIATVSSTGTVAGVTAGTAVISYGVTNTCGTSVATETVTVDPLPVIATISGSSNLCRYYTTTLSSSVSGGIWTSSNPSIASVSSGVVYGVGVGTAIISYSFTNTCGTTSAIKTVTVGALPAFGTIAGPSAVCRSSAALLTSPFTGGTWSSGDPGIASVNTAGLVTGLAPGIATISYATTNTCGIAVDTFSITVEVPYIVAPVTGGGTACVNSAIILSDVTPGGIWASGISSIATVSSTGVVTGIKAGSTLVYYTLTNSCGPVSASASVNFLPSPLPVIIADDKLLSTTATYQKYQWYIGTTPIPGGVDSIYKVKVSGRFSVTVMDVNGCSGSSTIIEFIIPRKTINGITNTAVGISDVNVFPNPNKGSFTIACSLPLNKQAHVTITNLLGQKVKELDMQGSSQLEVQLDQPAGIYMVTIFAGNDRLIEKIIIQ